MMSESQFSSLMCLLSPIFVAPLLCYAIVHFRKDVLRNRLNGGRYINNSERRIYRFRHICQHITSGLFILPALVIGFMAAISLPIQSDSNLFPIVAIGIAIVIGLLSLFYGNFIWQKIYKMDAKSFDKLERDLRLKR